MPQDEWFEIVEGEAIHQGDIFEECPILSPDPDADDDAEQVPSTRSVYDLVVMSQTCDLEQRKIKQVLLCPVWYLSEMHGYLSTTKGKEDARRGNLPAFHLINKCEIKGFERDYRVVDFRDVYTLPADFLRHRAVAKGQRLRILSPYREHLSQAFARFFMRVGLPVDIPPFK